MAVTGQVRSGIRIIFNQLRDLVEVAIVQRKRSTGSVSSGAPVVASGYNPRSGYGRAARNIPNPQTRTVTRAEDPNIDYNLADISPFPTAASPTPLPNTPEGTIRFAVNALALTPKGSLADVLRGGRKADLEALFQVADLPMLDGKRFLPSSKDLVRVNDNIYIISSAELDPTRSIMTAQLMSDNTGGDQAEV